MRGLAAAGFSLGIAALTVARAGNAPLAEAKQQLEVLQQQRAATNSGARSESPYLRRAMPALDPAGGAPLPPFSKPGGGEEREKWQREQARRNWLLDGFDGQRKRSRTDPDSVETSAEATPLDPADPNYFLRVYERQRAQRRAQQEVQRPLGAPDAFAPFMREWLAGSPVREALVDFGGGDGRGTPSASHPATTPGDNSSQSSRGATAGMQPASKFHTNRHEGWQGNPFIQALGLPPDSPTQTGANRSSAPAPAAATVSVSSSSLAADEGKPVPSRASRPPADDARKYLPQLRKF